MKKEIPMLFSTPMVQAILNGSKTETRRTNGLDAFNGIEYTFTGMAHAIVKGNKQLHAFFQQKPTANNIGGTYTRKCPYGCVGDVLWVREAFISGNKMDDADHIPKIWYKATDENLRWYDGVSDWPIENVPWKPSIHMPKDVARIWLEIVDIRVERLHDITEKGAIAEGIESCIASEDKFGCEAAGLQLFRNYYAKNNSLTDYPCNGFGVAVDSYESLWKSINDSDSWNANPYVCVGGEI